MAEETKEGTDDDKLIKNYNELFQRMPTKKKDSVFLNDISLPLLIDFLHDKTDTTIGWQDIKFKNNGKAVGSGMESSILKSFLDLNRDDDDNTKKYSDSIYAFYFDPYTENSSNYQEKDFLLNYLKRPIVYCSPLGESKGTLMELLYGAKEAPTGAIDTNRFKFPYEHVDAWRFPKELYQPNLSMPMRTQPGARLDSAGQGSYILNGTQAIHFIHDLNADPWKQDQEFLKIRRKQVIAAENKTTGTKVVTIFAVDVTELKKKTLDRIKKYCSNPPPSELLIKSIDILDETLNSFNYHPLSNTLSFSPHDSDKSYPFTISYNAVLQNLVRVVPSKYKDYGGRGKKQKQKKNLDDLSSTGAAVEGIMKLVKQNDKYKNANNTGGSTGGLPDKKIIEDFILKILKYMGDEAHSVNVEYISKLTRECNNGVITPIVFVEDRILMTRLISRKQCFIANSVDAFHDLPQYITIKSALGNVDSDLSKLTDKKKINEYLKKKIFILHNNIPPTKTAILDKINSINKWEEKRGAASLGSPDLMDTSLSLDDEIKREEWYNKFLKNDYYQHINNLVNYEKLIDIAIKRYDIPSPIAAAAADAADAAAAHVVEQPTRTIRPWPYWPSLKRHHQKTGHIVLFLFPFLLFPHSSPHYHYHHHRFRRVEEESGRTRQQQSVHSQVAREDNQGGAKKFLARVTLLMVVSLAWPGACLCWCLMPLPKKRKKGFYCIAEL